MKTEKITAALRCSYRLPGPELDCRTCPYHMEETVGGVDYAGCECGRMIADAADRLEELVDRCARYAEEIAVLGKQRTWISVSEYLPQSGKTVLCWYEYHRYGNFNCMYADFGIGYFWNGHWMGEVSNGRNARVLAWMPLPAKPEEAKL